MARARLLQLHVDEQRPGRARRAHRLDLQPQFRGPPGQERQDPPDGPGNGRRRRRHRPPRRCAATRLRVRRSGGSLPPLRRIHESAYEQDPKARQSLEYFRTRPTEEIVESLAKIPGREEYLIVKPDGRVVQGNTRIKVLQERGYPVEDLPREIH